MTSQLAVTPDTPDAPGRKRPAQVAIYVAAQRTATTADASADLTAALTPLGFIGTVIDGEPLGADGWVIACTIGTGDGRMIRLADGGDDLELRDDLTWDEVRGAVARTLGTRVQVGRYVVVSHGVVFPGEGEWAPRASGLRPTQIVVGPVPRAQGPMVAREAGTTVRLARVDDVALVQAADPAFPADMLRVATTGPAKAVTWLFWRSGPWQGLVAARRLKVVHHTWGPEWAVIDPSTHLGIDDSWAQEAVEGLVSALRMPRAPGSELADFIGLPEGPARTELIRLVETEAPPNPIADVVRLVGLPAVADDVLAGRADLSGLDDVYLYEKKGLLRAIVDESPEDAAARADARAEFRAAMKGTTTASAEPASAVTTPPKRRWWEWSDSWVKSGLRKVLVIPVFGFAAWYFFAVGATGRAWFMIATGVCVLLVDIFSSDRRRPPRDPQELPVVRS